METDVLSLDQEGVVEHSALLSQNSTQEGVVEHSALLSWNSTLEPTMAPAVRMRVD